MNKDVFVLKIHNIINYCMNKTKLFEYLMKELILDEDNLIQSITNIDNRYTYQEKWHYFGYPLYNDKKVTNNDTIYIMCHLWVNQDDKLSLQKTISYFLDILPENRRNEMLEKMENF